MIQLFATDLDGTFLNKTHQIDDRRKQCIQDVIKNGKHFAISTGRNIEGIQRIDIWDYPIYFILMNGALIVNEQHEIIKTFRINPGFIEKMVDRYAEYGFEYTTKDSIYVTISKEKAIENFVLRRTLEGMDKEHIDSLLPRYVSQFHFSSTKEEIVNLDVLKINYFILDETIRKEMEEFFELNHEYINNTPSGKGYIEITDIEGNKANGVRILADYLNVSYDEVATFGDGKNDVSMLKEFPYSYAPEDGSVEALDAAHYRIEPHYKDSVMKKIYEWMEVTYE
ncbi:MAG: Cof-type HAD-IIB family hydrolase [Holdemanella sp.]|nr:Cof-type HAD-IIB family hydrolase [Holdemanella sp.]